MSHFTVLVIGPEPEAQLAPFQENNMGDCPSEYLEFNDVTEENKIRFEKYNEENNPGIQFANQEAYDLAFDEYMRNNGYKKNEETGAYGYWENPNAKWDWYQLGGRWTGMFKLKPDANKEFAVTGSPGLMTAVAEKGYADTALKGDIDVAGMIAQAKERALDEYEKIEKIFPDGIPKIEIPWEVITSDVLPYKDMTWDEKRAFYHNQNGIKAWKDYVQVYADSLKDINDGLRTFYLFANQTDYQCTKEEYVELAGKEAILTFAVIKDGKWYERGEMGWWGAVSNEKSKELWIEEYYNLIQSLPDNTLLSVYDCHI